jgi:hypothetical protein
MSDDPTRFIGALTGGEIEIRHRQPDAVRWHSTYFTGAVEAARYALRVGLALDTYVCGAPLTVRRGGSRAACDADVSEARALLADADTDAALDALAVFEPPPRLRRAHGLPRAWQRASSLAAGRPGRSLDAGSSREPLGELGGSRSIRLSYRGSTR